MIENTFGFLVAHWRIFRRPIIAHPHIVVSYTIAAIVLHNYLRTTESQLYCPPRYIDGEDGGGNVIGGSWKEEPSLSGLEPLRSVGSNHYAMSVSSVRDTFKDYFSSAAG